MESGKSLDNDTIEIFCHAMFSVCLEDVDSIWLGPLVWLALAGSSVSQLVTRDAQAR